MSSTSPTISQPVARPSPDLLNTVQEYTEPLYTEIRIPLPPLPTSTSSSPSITTTSTSTTPSTATSSPSRLRAHTLHTLSPFRRRRDSDTSSSPNLPKIQSPPAENSGEKHFSFSRGRGKARRVSVDALAVVPAMLMLKAELFTPEERREGEVRA